MPRYMLHTNICLYLMKHQPPEVAERFAQCFAGDVVILATTLAELEFGTACSGEARQRNADALATFLSEVPSISFDGAAAAAYGPLRAAARERHRDALDKLIAAHALALNVVLVTNNTSEFAAFEGLRLENWVPGHRSDH